MWKLGSANFIFLGIVRLYIGIDCCGKRWVIFGSTMHAMFSWKLLKRDLMPKLTILFVRTTPSMTPAIETSRDCSNSFKRLTKSCVTKFIWDSLSSKAWHEWTCLFVSYTWTIVVDNKMLDARLLETHWVETGRALSNWEESICNADAGLELSVIDKCNKVLCFLLHLRYEPELQTFAWCNEDLKQLIQRCAFLIVFILSSTDSLINLSHWYNWWLLLHKTHARLVVATFATDVFLYLLTCFWLALLTGLPWVLLLIDSNAWQRFVKKSVNVFKSGRLLSTVIFQTLFVAASSLETMRWMRRSSHASVGLFKAFKARTCLCRATHAEQRDFPLWGLVRRRLPEYAFARSNVCYQIFLSLPPMLLCSFPWWSLLTL